MPNSYRWLALLLACSPAALAEPPIALEIGVAERLLVFAPHPDDEVLGVGGIVQKVLAQGGNVRIVIATAGDGFVEAVRREVHFVHPSFTDYLRYGETRLAEARRAVQTLGHGRIRLDLLGFPDGGLLPLLHVHWQRIHPERSLTTGVYAVPYADAEFPHRAYHGAELRAELLRSLREIRPTLVALPDPLDQHPDHAAFGLFALLALYDWVRGASHSVAIPEPWPRMLAYLVHWGGWPTGSHAAEPLDLRATPLQLPDDLPRRGQERRCLSLEPREVAIKRAALAQYRTQQRAMGAFLAAFVRATECVSVLTGRDAEAAEAALQREHAVLPQPSGGNPAASTSR